jgi:phage recombination protein Bet
MAVKNQLQPAQQQMQVQKPETVSYKVSGIDIRLDPDTVVNYLVSGDVQNVTLQEIVMFMHLCKAQGLNPFTKEAYLVKCKDYPAQIIVGKGALEKRAVRCQRFRGFEAGIIVRRTDGGIDWRTGTFLLPEEQLVGGWARVYVDGFTRPVESAVSLKEYNTTKSVWAQKPATMIRKVAKVQALREAFPEDMADMYEAEEFGMDYSDMPSAPVDTSAPAPEPVYVDAPPVQDYPAPPPMPEQPYDDFADIMMGGN